MAGSLHAKIRRKALIAGGLLVLVLATGTAAYKHIGGEQATLLDSLYMVVITIATIGLVVILGGGGAVALVLAHVPADHQDVALFGATLVPLALAAGAEGRSTRGQDLRQRRQLGQRGARDEWGVGEGVVGIGGKGAAQHGAGTITRCGGTV